MKKSLSLFVFNIVLCIVVCSQEVLYPFCEKKKTGWINNKGEVVIPATFYTPCWEAAYFYNGIARVCSTYGSTYGYGYINQSGEFITLNKYNYCEDFSEKLALVKENGSYGYINMEGKYEIEPQYVYAASFKEGVALARKDNKYGYIGHDGMFVIQPSYLKAESFSDGLAYVESESGRGWIDKKGNAVIWSSDSLAVFSDKVTALHKSFSCGVVAFQYVAATTWIGWKLHLWWLFKSNGEYIKPQVEVYDIDRFSEGLACVGVVEDPTYSNVSPIGCYIDTEGFVVINNKIERHYSIVSGERFSEGYAAVLLYDENKKKTVGYGYINRHGAVMIEPQFDYAGEFINGIALVEKGSKAYYINKKGETIFKFKF